MAREVFHIIYLFIYLFIYLCWKFQRNKFAQAGGVNGLNGRTVHEFVEEERVKGISFVTIQHYPMADKTVLGTD